MSKYFECAACGHRFAEDDARVLWDSDGRTTINYNACPSCGHEVLTELEPCRICGALVPEGADYCDKCKWEVRKIWEHAVEKVMERNDLDYTVNESLLIEFMQDSMGVI